MRNEFVPFQNELFPDSYTKLSFSSGPSINDVVSKLVIFDPSPPSPPAPSAFSLNGVYVLFHLFEYTPSYPHKTTSFMDDPKSIPRPQCVSVFVCVGILVLQN